MKTDVDFINVINTVFSVVNINVLLYYLSLSVCIYEMDFNSSLSANERIEGHSIAKSTYSLKAQSDVEISK